MLKTYLSVLSIHEITRLLPPKQQNSNINSVFLVASLYIDLNILQSVNRVEWRMQMMKSYKVKSEREKWCVNYYIHRVSILDTSFRSLVLKEGRGQNHISLTLERFALEMNLLHSTMSSLKTFDSCLCAIGPGLAHRFVLQRPVNFCNQY